MDKFNVLSVNAVVDRIFDKDTTYHIYTGIKKEKDAFFYPGEMHDRWEIVYVETGKVTVAENDKIYDLSEGQAIFHAPMEFHRFWVKTENLPTRLRIASFKIDTNIEQNLSKGVFTFTISEKEEFMEIIKLLSEKSSLGYWAENIKATPVENLFAIKALEKFLLGLIADNSPDKTQDYSTGARRYKEVIKVLKEHIGEDLTVEEVSRLSHLSISYIKKLFSFYAGCGVMQYFIKLKVLKAIKYLQEGYSVGEISDMLGFSNPSYFSVVFKKETGKSPVHYKQK